MENNSRMNLKKNDDARSWQQMEADNEDG